MLRCWDVDPTCRPCFSELSITVAAIIATLKAAAATITDHPYVHDDHPQTEDEDCDTSRTAPACRTYVNDPDHTSTDTDYLRPRVISGHHQGDSIPPPPPPAEAVAGHQSDETRRDECSSDDVMSDAACETAASEHEISSS